MFEGEPIDPAALAARLDEAGRGVLSPYSVAEAVVLSDAEKEGPMAALLLAFQLYAREGRQLAPGQRYFALTFGGEVSDVQPEVLDVWVTCADHVSEPVCQARLHDLCFELRRGNIAHHIRAACEAYLSMASNNPHSAGDDIQRISGAMRRMHELSRVLSLGKRSKMEDVEARAVAALLDAAQQSLDSGHPGPGELLGLLDPLIDTSSDPRVDRYLGRARTAFEGDAYSTAETIMLQVRRAGDEATRERLRREQVSGYIEFAMKGLGGLRQMNLEIAIKLARDFGFADLLDQATLHLQEMTVEDLGFQKIQRSISIDRDQVEQFLAHFTVQPGWMEALAVVIGIGPPSGKVDDNRRSAAVAKAASPLMASIPQKRVGGDGLPRYVARSEDEKDEYRLAEQESMRLKIWAGLIFEALYRIEEKWHPQSDDLAAFLGANHHVQPAVAASLARAFRHFFDGDPEASAYIALPRVEALVRDLVLVLNLPVYRTQRERTPGQYPGLGALVPELIRAGMDESWGRYLTTLLSGPAGWNVRNEALHGFLSEVGPPLAALILVAALYLCIGIPLSSPDADEAESESHTEAEGDAS